MQTHVLARAETDAAVAAERRRLADLADSFDAGQWATQSLCSAWTVVHVVAHLTTTTRATNSGKDSMNDPRPRMTSARPPLTASRVANRS